MTPTELELLFFIKIVTEVIDPNEFSHRVKEHGYTLEQIEEIRKNSFIVLDLLRKQRLTRPATN